MPFAVRNGGVQLVLATRPGDRLATNTEVELHNARLRLQREARLAEVGVPVGWPGPDYANLNLGNNQQIGTGIWVDQVVAVPVADDQAEPAYKSINSELDQAEVMQANQEAGMSIIKSDPFTLLLDIDSVRDERQLTKGLALAKELFPTWLWSVERWDSKSGNLHVKINLGPEARIKGNLSSGLSSLARVLLEVCLGSDRMRGLYAAARLINKLGLADDASVLFKPGQGPKPAEEEGDSV